MAITEDCPPPPEFHTLGGGTYSDEEEEHDMEYDDEEYEDDDEDGIIIVDADNDIEGDREQRRIHRPPTFPANPHVGGLCEVHRTESGTDHHRCVSFFMSCQTKSPLEGYSALQACSNESDVREERLGSSDEGCNGYGVLGRAGCGILLNWSRDVYIRSQCIKQPFRFKIIPTMKAPFPYHKRNH
ncbi:unnamed protein product [Malus baccata var. baccata]